MTFALSRMIYSLARDGLLPKAMKQLDPKTRIPKNATLVAGSMAAIAGGVFHSQYRFLLKHLYLDLPGYVGLALLKLRKEHGAPGPGEFKTPLVSSLANPIDCGLSVLYDPVFPIDLAGLRVTLLIGVGIYFGYGYRHSEENQ